MTPKSTFDPAATNPITQEQMDSALIARAKGERAVRDAADQVGLADVAVLLLQRRFAAADVVASGDGTVLYLIDRKTGERLDDAMMRAASQRLENAQAAYDRCRTDNAPAISLPVVLKRRSDAWIARHRYLLDQARQEAELTDQQREAIARRDRESRLTNR